MSRTNKNPHRIFRKLRQLQRKVAAGEEELSEKEIRRVKRRMEAEREAENARFWVGKVKSADRLLHTTPVNRAAARLGCR
jgi:hypothetical protein